MNLTHKSLVGVATASALFIVSSMAHADGPTTPPTPPTTTTTEPVAAPVKRSPLPIVTMAVGGASALVGLCFYSLSSTNKTQATFAEGMNRDYGTTLDSQKLRAKSESETKTGTVLLAGGAVVAVGGLVWFFIDSQRVKSANADAKAKATAATTLRLTPAVGPGSTGAYLQGTF
jgi:hypothetical protein